MKEDVFIKKVPLCTWEELKEMVDSGLVSVASHSYSHKNLLEKNIDLDLEIVQSKKILEEHLKTNISTFVYPLGKFNDQIHSFTKKHYKYAMRIGSSFNLSWQNINKISYRIISDNLKTIDEQTKKKKIISYIWFYLLNTIRGR
jgi:peptidoglycan/xylan/chitin deacetylase (PgdA/CDA1 family)